MPIKLVGVWMRGLHKDVLLAPVASLLLLTGCSSHKVDEFFAETLDGGIPMQSRGLMSLPLAEVKTKAMDFDVWGAFELARRYEHGIGINADVQCAVYWYHMADTLPYPQCPNCTNALAAEMRPGLVHARAAVRRLAQQPDADIAINPTRPGHTEAFNRCFDAVT